MDNVIAAGIATGLTELIKRRFGLKGDEGRALAVLIALCVVILQDAANGANSLRDVQSFALLAGRGLVMGLTIAGLYEVGDGLAKKRG